MKSLKVVIALLMGAKCFAANLQSHLLEAETNISQYFKQIDFIPCKSDYRAVDCIYVINLDERPEKWDDTQFKLDQYNVQYNRFSGINGWNIPDEPWQTFWNEQGVDPSDPPLPKDGSHHLDHG